MSTTTSKSQEELDSIFKQKKIVRSTVRKSLKGMDPSLRLQQGSIFFLSLSLVSFLILETYM